ncbi:TetR/AcrR family transcriptional regulator [Streptomyces nodosus]|uniref:TetR family transcriptional regulator n=2 Tax=Streptomyces nodosus TaxID=40318 RepID=A0A5P2W9I0_9ACTN|nr:TetR/AcrR family transcriptional regulator [Streptomyces nodosus]MBB4794359.1 AcrR family transcriptional regulator [Streptomyces nodosus]QEV41491.1 TetR family transcriptional regulator [Streptomyces nodosus]
MTKLAGYDDEMVDAATKLEGSGMRDVARRAVRAEIAATAMELFLAEGYEETTVKQIGAAVGMAGRTLFRYFDTKEDLVIGGLIELGADVAAALARRPADEDPWNALRHALQVCVESMEGDELGLRRATMLANTPSLRTAMLDKQLRWQQMLVPHIENRLPGPEQLRALQSRALVSAALTCLDVGATVWTEVEGSQPLTHLVDAAFAAVRT